MHSDNVNAPQTLSGINVSLASNVTFLLAIRMTVAEILLIPEKTISLPIMTSMRRLLLSGMYVSYDINVTSHRPTESFKVALLKSVTTGDFLTVLHSKSSILLQSTYDLHFVDYMPTTRPTSSPSSVFSNQEGKQMMSDSKYSHCIIL